ncbi:hypothetical protein [Aliiglaciecola sp. LCG003]|uniref:hypothetical protein n=1 Tax=Aliiglaciecola sp. LCG003 TaxID=3053655 RepID=UPI002573FB50|nr:hypothetical protein [Aliiglaciecola sp. LCG003]WJG10334.1 hypothetical protein QR722_04670 [Aliiglaciecola sp. LCG003]
MQLDNIAIEIKPRSSWSSFDLGCRMAVTWWRSLIGFWLVVTLPLFVLLNAWDLTWGMLIFWWCKPLYEKGLLYILSRAVFGERISIKQALRAWPAELKKDWFTTLTWRRLSPARGFNLAVAQLEGLTGVKRANRLNVLHRTTDDNSAWWTIICVHWESFLFMGLVALVGFIVPQGIDINFWQIFSSEDGQISLLFNIFLYLVYAMVAPFYISGSFAAYLNRRITLEAWDIELSFKKLIQKQPKGIRGKAISTLAAVTLLVCLSGFPQHQALADETAGSDSVVTDLLNNTQLKDSKPRDVDNIEFESEIRIERILANPPFSSEETVKKLRWIEEAPEQVEESKDSEFWPWLTSIMKIVSAISELVLWLVFGGLLVALIYFFRDHIRSLFTPSGKADTSEPMSMMSFSQAYQGDDLPDDPASEMDQLMARGAYRQLLSLMLITSLMEISKQQALPLTKSMTERECLNVIKQSIVGERSEYMHSLIDTWVKLAWAHQWPQLSKMQQLSEQWKSLFSASQAVA